MPCALCRIQKKLASKAWSVTTPTANEKNLKTMNYGVPYKGSKNKIVQFIVGNLPKATTFVDLFAGGCAVTHAAMLTRQYKRFIANDITDAPLLFADAVSGRYADERRWISREKFFELKNTDPYVRYCWSFGNNGRSYLYSIEIEPWERALHFARVFGDYEPLRAFGIKGDGSFADVKAHADEYKEKYTRWWLAQQQYTTDELAALIAEASERLEAEKEELRAYLLEGLRSSGLTQSEVNRRLGNQMANHYFGRSQWEFPTKENYEQMRTFMPALDKDYNEVVGLERLQRLQSLESLESLQRLERLQSLESLQNYDYLEITRSDYRAVEIPPDSVVYCDIPYRGTDDYNGEQFDHEAFYDWAESQCVPVFISEYAMPPERFDCVAEIRKNCFFSATNVKETTERLFVPKKQKVITTQQLKLF